MRRVHSARGGSTKPAPVAAALGIGRAVAPAVTLAVALAFMLADEPASPGRGAAGGALFVVNESASLPRGVYVRRPGTAVGRGRVVALAQPLQAKAYLGGLGMPPEVLLIKRVAATGGEPVCRRRAEIATPLRTVAVLDRDGRGFSLPAWSGCRLLAADEVFLLGDTATSFDSRYFGPVRRSQLSGVYRALVTW